MTFNFQQFVLNEGLVKLDTDALVNWTREHFSEFLTKLKETLKNGYDTYIDDSIKTTNAYTNEPTEVTLYIKKNIVSKNKDAIRVVEYEPSDKTITVNATAFNNQYKTIKAMKSGLFQAIVHELTHEVDPGVPHKKKADDYQGYINSSHEFAAHVQQYVQVLKSLNDKQKSIILERMKSGKKFGIKDIDEFISYLTPDNKQKFYKLIWQNVYQPKDQENG